MRILMLGPIEEAYCLEVCSPGIERELIRDEHFTGSIQSDRIWIDHSGFTGKFSV